METSKAENSQAQDADQNQVNRQQKHSNVLGDIHHLCFGFRQAAARLITPPGSVAYRFTTACRLETEV